MGEFEKNQDQAGQKSQEQDDKTAFGQFDKDQQQQQGESKKDEFADEQDDKTL